MGRSFGRICKDIAYSLTPPLIARGLRAARDRVGGKTALPVRRLTDIFPAIGGSTLTLPAAAIEAEPGMLPLRELAILAAICRHLNPRTVFEIGTFRGATTAVLGRHCPKDAVIYTLDLPPGTTPTHPLDIGGIAGTPYVVGERFRGTDLAARIIQLYGDSATFDFSPFRGSIDLCFVDGNHACASVLSDSRHAFECLRPGGVILWDDYHPDYGEGVIRALHELEDRGIVQVWNTRLALFVDDAPDSTRRRDA